VVNLAPGTEEVSVYTADGSNADSVGHDAVVASYPTGVTAFT